MPAEFGTLADGRTAACFTLENEFLRVRITDFGARLVSIEMPGRDNVWDHVLLGFDDVRGYEISGGSFGAVLGRYANRIGQGRFRLDGRHYQLAVNDGDNTLHGGPMGFGLALWQLQEYRPAEGELALTHISADGDQGFPGEMFVRADYRLDGSALVLTLEAASDRDTVVNLSSHPYFNLAGAAAGDCLAQRIEIAAERFVVTDKHQIPTGELRPVQGTVFDFRAAKAIGADLRKGDEQLLIARGYDHCFVTATDDEVEAHFQASAYDAASGRMLKIFSDAPGVQFYSGNSLNGSVVGRGGVVYRQSAGFAFEAQNFPDAPNQRGFPSAVLRPGETFSRTIRYLFSVAGRT
jgi:aldose 1-epimerase